MDVQEANEIIDAYKASLAEGTVGDTILRKVSLLPYTKAKIKYAYFVLLENIIKKDGCLAVDLREELVSSYSKLNTFIDDEQAEKYAKNYEEWQSKKSSIHRNPKNEKFIKQYIAFTHFLQSSELFDEINDYIEELLGQK